MSLRRKYLRVLSELIPSGAIGVSLLLGSATPSDATRQPAGAGLTVSDVSTVSERLAAIRGAVSEITGAAAEPRVDEQQLAWGNWWRNGGWGNWRNGWRNGGWHNWWRNW
jgi:hypothetical protein